MQQIYNANPQKVIVGMVGLPARGKSYISKKIYRFLNWLGFNTQVFNVGNYRRKYMIDSGIEAQSDFFDFENKQCFQIREMCAQMCLDDLITYVNNQSNKVAIFDGTNTTRKRRNLIAQQLTQKLNCKYQLLWIESICNDQTIITQTIQKVKLNCIEYKEKSYEEAEKDFRERIKFYQKVYQTLDKDQGFAFIKTINVGEGIEINKVHGYLAEKIMTYTINLTISPKRNIYLSRHGQSQHNVEQRLGGNSQLSFNGMKYARALPKVLEQLITNEQQRQNLTILTSTLKRTINTAEQIKLNKKPPIQLRILDQINAGICQNLTNLQVEQKYPDIYSNRKMFKLEYRYPSGQSYIDVIGRLEPLIYWIQRQKHSVLVIGHQAIIRCISGYFFNIDLKQLPHVQVPLHTLIKLTPANYSFSEQVVKVNLQNGHIMQILKLQKKKFSIDYDGSQTHSSPSQPKKNQKFKSIRSAMDIFK